MRAKIFTTIVSFLFISVLIWCPVASFLDELNILLLPENKNIKLPQKHYGEDMLFAPLLNAIEQAKAGTENTYTNALPLYEYITLFMLNSERTMREAMLSTLYGVTGVDVPFVEAAGEKKEYKVKRIGTEEFNAVWAFTEIDKTFTEGWTDKTVRADWEELQRRLEVQIGHVNRIAAANGDVNFYVYVCTRFQETDAFAEIIKDAFIMRSQVSTKPLMDEFLQRLDMSAINDYDFFKIDTLEKRLERVFKTDHHETAKGAYSIYSDVISMMAKDSPQIGAPREINGYVYFEGIDLRGSHVWQHGYTEIRDDFYDYDVTLPEHTMYRSVQDGAETRRAYSEYMNGNYNNGLFTDHYAEYYPYPVRIEYPGNSTGSNLLIIGDSYSWAAGELIASNFDNTYIIYWTYPSFNYNEFIEENNITDVLLIQVSDRLLFDIQNDTQLGRVLTF